MMNKVVTKKLCSTRIIIFFVKNAHNWFANCKAGHNNLDRQFFGKKCTAHQENSTTAWTRQNHKENAQLHEKIINQS